MHIGPAQLNLVYRLIHENLWQLDTLGKSVIISYSMIPGYHRLGTTEYDQISTSYTARRENTPAQRQQKILELFLAKGHHAQAAG